MGVDDGLLVKLIGRLETMESLSLVLSKLFDRLEPFSVRKRHNPKNFTLIDVINEAFDVFHGELKSCSIEMHLDQKLNIKILGWKEDFRLIFANLIENSIHWLRSGQQVHRRIDVVYRLCDLGPAVHYTDNGPGIPEELIREQAIFEPGFSTKRGGTGLGLAIAGEAAERNGWKLKAIHNKGAKFVLDLFPGIKEENK